MAQRISRAKQTIKAAGLDFSMPTGTERADRLRAVLHVLYLVFNEGYTATDGDELTVPALSREAIRLTRWLHRLLPHDAEVTGLLALMLLTDARRAARTHRDGSLVPLAEQDRRQMGPDADRGGNRARRRGAAAPARPAPTSCRPPSPPCMTRPRPWPTPTGRRSWPCTTCWNDLAPNPFTTLNRAVALAMVHGPAAGLDAAGGAGRGQADGAASPPARDPRASAGTGRGSRRGGRRLPAGGAARDQRARTPLPGSSGRPAGAVKDAACGSRLFRRRG